MVDREDRTLVQCRQRRKWGTQNHQKPTCCMLRRLAQQIQYLTEGNETLLATGPFPLGMARQTPCRLHRRPSSGTGSCRPQHVHDSASSFEFFPPQTEATTAAPRLRSPVPLSSFAAHIRRSQCNHNSFAEPHRHRQTPHHKTPPQPGRSPQRSPQPHQSRSQSASPALLRTTITDDPPANPIPARSTRLVQYAKPLVRAVTLARPALALTRQDVQS